MYGPHGREEDRGRPDVQVDWCFRLRARLGSCDWSKPNHTAAILCERVDAPCCISGGKRQWRSTMRLAYVRSLPEHMRNYHRAILERTGVLSTRSHRFLIGRRDYQQDP